MDNVLIDLIEVYHCPACGEELVRLPSVFKLNTLIGLKLIDKSSLLNGKEVKYLRKNLQMRSKELAEIMGVDQATISRWESGKQNLSPSNDRFLRLIYTEFKKFDKDIVFDLLKNRFKTILGDKVSENINVSVSELDYIPDYDDEGVCLCQNC